MGCSPPSCSAHGISQSRILEWVAISFFRGSSWRFSGSFLTQGLNLHLLHWQANSLPLSHQGSPERDKLRTELQTEDRVNTTTDQSRLYGEKRKQQMPLYKTNPTIFQLMGQDFNYRVLGRFSSAPAGQRLEMLAAQ